MDLLVVTGVIRCPVCGQVLEVIRSFGTRLRSCNCVNPLCHHYGFPKEISHYTRVPGQPTSHPVSS